MGKTIEALENELSEARRKVNGLENNLRDSIYESEKTLIKNLPPGFTINQDFDSGSYDYCFELKYNNKCIAASRQGKDHEIKLSLAQKAHDFWNLAKIVFPDKVAEFEKQW